MAPRSILLAPWMKFKRLCQPVVEGRILSLAVVVSITCMLPSSRTHRQSKYSPSHNPRAQSARASTVCVSLQIFQVACSKVVLCHVGDSATDEMKVSFLLNIADMNPHPLIRSQAWIRGSCTSHISCSSSTSCISSTSRTSTRGALAHIPSRYTRPISFCGHLSSAGNTRAVVLVL